jgi:hypothetical protein
MIKAKKNRILKHNMCVQKLSLEIKSKLKDCQLLRIFYKMYHLRVRCISFIIQNNGKKNNRKNYLAAENIIRLMQMNSCTCFNKSYFSLKIVHVYKL